VVYNALLSAAANAGRLDAAEGVAAEMAAAGVARNAMTWSTLIQAAKTSGQWHTALDLYREMRVLPKLLTCPAPRFLMPLGDKHTALGPKVCLHPGP
jgi:pentatricopeptide repeat protein